MILATSRPILPRTNIQRDKSVLVVLTLQMLPDFSGDYLSNQLKHELSTQVQKD
jgi:hypothetical protein